MKKRQINIGDKFDKLTIIMETKKELNKRKFLCECECGKIKSIFLSNLTTGKSKSCGCDKTSLLSRNFKHGANSRIKRTVEYKCWAGIKTRCTNPNSKSYKNYGGRGIKMCDRWLNSFENFYQDIGKKPSSDYSIDRINVNGDYEPKNVRWATIKEQANNRRNNIKNGKN